MTDPVPSNTLLELADKFEEAIDPSSPSQTVFVSISWANKCIDAMRAAPEPPADARMKAALELMALNVQQEDENGPVIGALDYGDVEMICYHGLGLIPMADPDLRSRLDKLEQIERDRAAQPQSAVSLVENEKFVNEQFPLLWSFCNHSGNPMQQEAYALLAMATNLRYEALTTQPPGDVG